MDRADLCTSVNQHTVTQCDCTMNVLSCLQDHRSVDAYLPPRTSSTLVVVDYEKVSVLGSALELPQFSDSLLLGQNHPASKPTNNSDDVCRHWHILTSIYGEESLPIPEYSELMQLSHSMILSQCVKLWDVYACASTQATASRMKAIITICQALLTLLRYPNCNKDATTWLMKVLPLWLHDNDRRPILGPQVRKWMNILVWNSIKNISLWDPQVIQALKTLGKDTEIVEGCVSKLQQGIEVFSSQGTIAYACAMSAYLRLALFLHPAWSRFVQMIFLRVRIMRSLSLVSVPSTEHEAQDVLEFFLDSFSKINTRLNHDPSSLPKFAEEGIVTVILAVSMWLISYNLPYGDKRGVRLLDFLGGLLDNILVTILNITPQHPLRGIIYQDLRSPAGKRITAQVEMMEFSYGGHTFRDNARKINLAAETGVLDHSQGRKERRIRSKLPRPAPCGRPSRQ